ncbi:DUF3613 domain-containing protein [Methylomonas sp. HYX-M1]|uniref:DUF3613 domain-containing protein n=1 Tax=Methylomonas sp. HYX-M1 TaxID=3139307 RepID=UPI00345BEF32
MRYFLLLALIGLTVSRAGVADEAAYPEPPLGVEQPVPAVDPPQFADNQTRLWLQRQSSGAVAGNRYAIPGQAATASFQRYLQSFSHPIPLHFETTGSGSSGGGSGSGGSSGGR